MIKNILKLFGYKVFNKDEYDHLTNQVARCGVYYRALVSNDNSYHHGQRCVTVPLSEMGNICLVENCIWEDVKEKIKKGVENEASN